MCRRLGEKQKSETEFSSSSMTADGVGNRAYGKPVDSSSPRISNVQLPLVIRICSQTPASGFTSDNIFARFLLSSFSVFDANDPSSLDNDFFMNERNDDFVRS